MVFCYRHWPSEKQKESVMVHLMQKVYTPIPRPPGPTRKEADLLVFTLATEAERRATTP